MRQNVDSLDLRVDAIADRNIDQAIFGTEGNGRFGAKFGKRIQPLSGPSAQNNGQYSFHKAALSVPVSRLREVSAVRRLSYKQYSTQCGYVNRILKRDLNDNQEGEFMLISGDPNVRDEPRGQ